MSKAKKQEGVPVSIRFRDEDHEVLAQIAAQVGWEISKVARLAVRNLIEEVRATGELPLPKVKLAGEEAAA